MPLLRFLLLLPLYMVRLIGTFCSVALRLLGTIFAPVIGHIHWEAPMWTLGAKRLLERIETFTKRYPLRIGAFVLFVLLASVGGVYGYQWYLNRPGAIEIAPTTYQEANASIAKIPTPTNYRNQHPILETLVIDFGVQAAPLEALKKPITEGIKLSPELEGTWRWNNEGQQLIFTPKKEWAVAQKYTLSLTPSKLLAPTIKTETKRLEFTTEAMSVTVDENEFYQDPINPSQKKSIFHAKFNYPVDIASFEKAVKLTITTPKGVVVSTPKFSVTYNDSKMDAWVHSEPIALPEEVSQMKLHIKKGVLSSKANSNEAPEVFSAMDIPGLYTLKLTQVSTSVVKNEKEKYEQVLMVQTSDAIKGADLSRATTLWLLPQKHPNYPKIDNYQWNQASITEQILSAATPLSFKLTDTHNEYEKIQSLIFNASPNRYIFAQFDFGKEMQSIGGYKLKGTQSRTLKVKDYPNLLQFMSKGAILSLHGEQKISIAAQNVAGMNLSIKRIAPTQLHHLVSFNENPDFAHMNFSGELEGDGFENHFIERFEHKQAIKVKTPEATSYESIDLKPYFSSHDQNKRGVFLLQLAPWDIRKNAPLNYASFEETHENRFVIITDIGMIVKRLEDSSSDVFVQSISTGLPIAGATVSIVAQNGKAILTQTSDASGHVRFGSLDGFQNEKMPIMYLVEKNDDLSFLPMKYNTTAGAERSLNLSRFDIGGVKNTQEGELKAYMFSDRNLYRPGDTFNIASIVKAAKWETSLKGIPLVAEVYDSRNVLMHTKTMALDESGLNELSYTTQENAPTGEWHVYLYRINKTNHRRTSLGHTSVTLKEFEPDRLNVAINIEPKNAKQWLKPEELNATVVVNNLFGTPAQNLRVSTTLTLSPAAPSFAPFGEYHFYEDHAKTQNFKTKLEDALTNKEGVATLKLGLSSYAPASYYVQLLAEAFEAQSGRSVVAISKTLVSPYDFFIGAKADGDLAYIAKDSARNLHFIAVDPTIKPTAVSAITLGLIENTYISVLTQQKSGVYKYESKLKEKLVGEQVLDISEKGYTYAVPTDKPGNYTLLLKDATGHVMYKTSFSVAGNANVTRSLERDAELKLTLSQKEYQAGDTIDIAINAPYTGSGLITIERDKVYAWKWFKTSTTHSTQSIQLPKELDGNAYVNVQFIRDPNANEIFMSPLSYGVVPFNIGLGKHQSTLTLQTPSVIKPGERLPIKVSTSEKQKVIVFAVDEGILQVARYQFQDPLKFFFRKKELSVDSLQILDLILPEFSKLKELSAPGGDMSGLRGTMHLNPFKRKSTKAVAYWSGITEVEGEATVHFDIPDSFNGKLKVMAVAVSPERIGATQTNTVVRGDFVLSPNAPFVVAPNDEFEVALSVANNLDTNGTAIPISVEATSSKHVVILENATQTLSLSGKNEGVLRFKMKATSTLGNADLVFKASYAHTSITRKESLSVRPSVPYRTQVNLGQMSAKEEHVGNLRTMYEAYAKRNASVSYSPLVLTNGLASYLDNYPYACSEQIVSRAIPTLFLHTHPELGNTDTQTLQHRLERTFDTLRTRQNMQGGFGMWRATIETDPFVSAYVVQFLLEAKEKGKAIPEEMLQKATLYLQNVASDETRNTEYGLRLRAFSVYLLTRQNKVTTNLLSTVQSRLQNRFGEEWKHSLSALYLAASYQMLKMDKEANALLQGPWKSLEKAYSQAWWTQDFNDPLIQDATILYIITKHFPERIKDIPTKALENMVLMLRGERYTSLSSAMSILALESYSQALMQTVGTNELSIKALNNENQTRLISTLHGLAAQANFLANDTQIIFNNPLDMPAWYSITQEGFDQSIEHKSVKNGLEIIRTYTDLEGKKINHVTLGEKINVHILIRSISSDVIHDLAIIDLIPGGFEIVQQTPPKAPSNEENSEESAWTSPLQVQGSTWSPTFSEAREDRMIIFGEANKETQEFVYQIKANNLGTYTLPSAFGESMYDRAIHALFTEEGTLRVSAPASK